MKKSLVLLGVLMMPLLSIAQLPTVQSISNTRFIEGGVGLDESEAIQIDLKNWPLLIEFSQASGKKAEWVADVFVVIKDAKGNQVLAHQLDGPLLLVDLMPGKYSVESSYNGQKKVTGIDVEGGQHKKININWK